MKTNPLNSLSPNSMIQNASSNENRRETSTPKRKTTQAWTDKMVEVLSALIEEHRNIEKHKNYVDWALITLLFNERTGSNKSEGAIQQKVRRSLRLTNFCVKGSQIIPLNEAQKTSEAKFFHSQVSTYLLPISSPSHTEPQPSTNTFSEAPPRSPNSRLKKTTNPGEQISNNTEQTSPLFDIVNQL